jgi:ATP-dependent DNA helicase RecQ
LFRPLGNGGWDLSERSVQVATSVAEPRQEIDPLVDGALNAEFAVIDVETTGTSFDTDEIVQVAAVRVREGALVAGFNRHVRTKSATVPPSLQLRMGWETVPAADLVSIDEALSDLADFVGEDAAVAWNAAFDIEFLSRAGWQHDRHVDALAVALLVLPGGPHRLSDVAERLDIVQQPLRSIPVDGPIPSEEHLHDALVDCQLAAKVHLETTQGLRTGVSEEVAALLPELPAAESPADRTGMVSTRERPALVGESGTEILEEIIGATGRELRRTQREATLWSDRALRGESAVIEAPTGTGKTLAYLSASLAAVTRGRRVAIVTAFKNLQDQLLEEFADIDRVVDTHATVAVLKGAGNYFCLRRLQRLGVDIADAPLDLRYAVAVLTTLVQQQPLATRDEVPAWLLHRVPGSLAIVDEVAVACGHAECGRSRAIDAANAADVVVMNQVLWVAPPEDLQPVELAVIDEAHDLEGMATLALTEEIGSTQLLALSDRLVPPGRGGLLSAVRHAGGDVAAATQLARRLRSTAIATRDPLAEFARAISPDADDERGGSVRLRRAPASLHPGAWLRASDALRDLHDTLQRLTSALAELSAYPTLDRLTRDDLAALQVQAREHDELLGKIPAVRETAFVHFIEIESRERGGWRLARSPVEVAPLLQETWETLEGFALLSATLQTGGNDFGFVVDRLGLRSHIPGGACALESDFNFDDNVVLGIARWFDAIPVPRFMPEFQAETADELNAMAQFGDGRMLALFTATTRLRDVRELIADALAHRGLPVLAQGDGPRAALLEEFRSRSEAVLLGTRSFWQGIDVPGDSLSFVEIEKLPFPHLRDPVTEARLELLRRQSRNEFAEYLLPSMTIALKQGFGRLVRRPSDRGAVVILDRRLHSKPYRDSVLSSLPGYRPRNLDAEQSRSSFYAHIDRSLPGLISAQGRQFLLDLPSSTPSLAMEVPHVARSGDRASRRGDVLTALNTAFGFHDFRSTEQEDLFWRIHDGEDVLGILPTGAGKSLPFQLSALVGDGLTLVVSPLVALMRDQVENLLDRGIRQVGALVGQMTADERDEVLRRARSGAISLLYVAPERLRDPVFLDHLRSFDLRRLVVDEAHCVSLWGPSFRPDFLAIRASLDRSGHESVPLAALTATATPEIEIDMRRALRIESAGKISTPAIRPNLRLVVLGNDPRIPGDRFTNNKERLRHLIRILASAERRSEAAIVYVSTVALAEQVAAQLQQAGMIARAYHGRLDPWSRQNVEELFRDGEVDVIVATKAFGMGIDRSDVRYVVHLGCPADLESYYQEAGRAGRDGEPSWCLLMPIAASDRRTQEWFIDQVGELDSALEEATALLREKGLGRHLVDLEELAAQLGLEEVQARVVLHYLEADGLLERGPDQSTVASVLLLEPPRDGVVAAVCDAAAMTSMVPAIVDLVELADRHSDTAAELEQRFIDESREGTLVFRPVRRMASIVIHETQGRRTPSTAVVTEQMYNKLDQMMEFASERKRCRQMTIRMYLGEPVHGMQACGVCDVCDPSLPRPWLDLPLDLVPAADRLMDVQLTCMYAVQWNESEVAAGRAPYGRSALRCVLAGDRFQLGRYTEGVNRQRRIRRAEASPYWASLSLLTNPTDKIRAAFETLDLDGCLTTRQFEVSNGHGTGLERYSYPALSDVGVRRLDLGLVSS